MDLTFMYMPQTYETTTSNSSMEDNTAVSNASIKAEDPSVKLTIRLIMQGKEVGSIIGKKGEIVKRFREESGAIINISDGSCPERIVTVSGSTTAIFKAFSLITKKFEEWWAQFNESGSAVAKAQIPIRLIVPASQCGSLIGKAGSKIKEIRETTGCSIQVASEMLPNSTERAVTLSGTAEQITQCIYHICCVMLESPPKGATIPYRPKPQVSGPVIVANGQTYTIQGQYALPTQEQMGGLTKNPLAGLAALGLAGMAPANTNLNPTALAALAGSQLRTSNQNRSQPPAASSQQQHEMTVPNDLIGCIIGKGGTKIAEIRQISGAMIRISNCEEREGGNTDRTITISGNPDAVALAQYLIHMSVELQKANLQEINAAANALPGGASGGGASGGLTAASAAAAAVAAAAATAGNGAGIPASATAQQTLSSNGTNANGASAAQNSLASAIPLAQLLAKPGALTALSSLQALGGLTDLIAAAGAVMSAASSAGSGNGALSNSASNGNATGSSSGGGSTASSGSGSLQSVHRSKTFTPRIRSPNNAVSERKSDRNKFNPY